jgi:hypothetical protein
VEAVKPCLMAFWEERALPAGLVGPVDFLALARLAASCFSEMGILRVDMVSDLSLAWRLGAGEGEMA